MCVKYLSRSLSEVRLDGLKWDLSCVCWNLRWRAGPVRGWTIPICAKNGNRGKWEKRRQGICGFCRFQAKRYKRIFGIGGARVSRRLRKWRPPSTASGTSRALTAGSTSSMRCYQRLRLYKTVTAYTVNVGNFFSQNLVFPRLVPLGVPVRGAGWLPGVVPDIYRGYSDALGLYECKVIHMI